MWSTAASRAAWRLSFPAAATGAALCYRKQPHSECEKLDLSALTAVSAVDGRYGPKTASLREHFSEYALHKNRTEVMIKWVLHMSHNGGMKEVARISPGGAQAMQSIHEKFDTTAAANVKQIERTTNHDLKACEYHIKGEMEKVPELSPLTEWVHFACTSEDVNNCAYALMLTKARRDVILPKMDEIIASLRVLATEHADSPMLSLTHGQTATPTTFGKEMANFAYRLQRHRDALANVSIVGKFNGATGNFNAHKTAYPAIDWPSVSSDFVQGLGINYQPYSTQIECHDFIAEMCDAASRFNTTLLDFDRDMWQYCSRNILKLRTVKGEVGSSTMPHKVNPIDFENSEGNIGISNALLRHFAEKLPVSRMQRDLSDSTVLRGLGTAFGHSLVAYEAALRALSRITVNSKAMDAELDNAWEVLAEPAQTLLRKYQVPGAYELLKEATRGQAVNEQSLRKFFESLDTKLPPSDMEALRKLTPQNYIGCAPELARAEGR